MKATFALLTDRETANLIAETAWRAHQRFGIGVSVRRLPPHVSLKQPFDTSDLEALTQYAGVFAASHRPFDIELTTLALWERPAENSQSGVLAVSVRESANLRELHQRLNRELTEHFGPRPADFDGDAYSFHCTIAAGVGSVAAYRAAFAAFAASDFRQVFSARELALFVYDDSGGEGEYMTYKTLPLGVP